MAFNHLIAGTASSLCTEELSTFLSSDVYGAAVKGATPLVIAEGVDFTCVFPGFC